MSCRVTQVKLINLKHKKISFYLIDTTYFDLYDTFNVIKTAIDMSIIDYQTNTSLYDPDMVIHEHQ